MLHEFFTKQTFAGALAALAILGAYRYATGKNAGV